MCAVGNGPVSLLRTLIEALLLQLYRHRVCESFELMVRVIYNTARQKERTETRTERDIFSGKPPLVLDSEERVYMSGVIRL